jgi:hypothetical protein
MTNQALHPHVLHWQGESDYTVSDGAIKSFSGISLEMPMSVA